MAQGLSPTTVMHEAEEIIEIHWLDMNEALSWVKNGQIIDGKTMLGLLLAKELIDPDQ